MHLSSNVSSLEPSATLAVAALCKQLRAEGRDILDLSVGEPDFRTPDFAAQAGIAAIVQGFTQYTPVPGIPALREMIAQHLERMAGRPVDPATVVVTAGAKQALFNACFVLFGEGEDVLLPGPYWTSYPELIRLARATPTVVLAQPEQQFKVTVADLDAATTSRTRGIILNSPSNPTGVIYSLPELDAIVRWAAERNLWIISDEVYGRLAFDSDRAPSVLDLDDALLERCIYISGASKAFAMTGWRIGFSQSPLPYANAMSALQSHITSNPSTPAQYAALAVFRDEPRVEHAVKAMVGVFRRRLAKALEALAVHLPAARVVPPAGAFYILVQVDAYYRPGIENSIAFCKWLLDEAGVALVPGTAFGDDRFVRLSFAAPEAEIAEAIRRIGVAVAKTVAASP